MKHTISVLHLQGCGGARALLDIAFHIAEVRADVSVEDVVIADWAEGATKGLRGSPTVLIDGHNLESDSQTPIGAVC